MKKKIIRGILGSGGIGIFQRLLTLVINIFLARLLGVDGYGIYSYFFSLILVLGLPISAGLPQLVVREVSVYQSNKDWRLLRGFLEWCTLTILVLSVIVCVLSYFFVPEFLSHNQIFDWKAFIWATMTLPLNGLALLRSAILRGLQRPILGIMPEGLLAPIVNISLLGILHLTAMDSGLQAWQAMMARAISSLSVFLLGLWLVSICLPLECTKVSSIKKNLHWLASVLPFTLLSGAQVLGGQSGVLLLGVISDSQSVSLYQSASQLSALIVAPLIIVQVVVAPYLAQLHHQGKFNELQKLVTSMSWLTLLLCLPLFLVYILLGKKVLDITFGTSFNQGYVTLAIMSISYIINVGFGPNGLVLEMTANEKQSLLGFVAGIFVNLIGGVMLIPIYGANGAALSMLASTLVWNYILSYKTRNMLGIKTSILTLPL